MTQVELAEFLGQPQSYVSKYERGERRIDLVEFMEIATALELDVQAFIGEYQQASRKHAH